MTAVLTEPEPSLASTTLPLRLVPAPTSAPPYDDEVSDGTCPAPLLRLLPPLDPPPPPARFDDEAWLASERTPTAQLPSATDMARTLVHGLLEVLAGVRPLQQLRRDTTPELYASLRMTMLRTRRDGGNRPGPRAIRSLHVQERPEGIAEVCATVRRGTRLGALALRLEGVDGRWQCTEVAGL